VSQKNQAQSKHAHEKAKKQAQPKHGHENAKNQAYLEHVHENQPKRAAGRSMLRAFWVGGLICVVGQLLSVFAEQILKLEKNDAAAFVPLTLVFLGALLTAIGLYDRIGTYAGAGSIVPITGFANSIAASAMEFKSEGLIVGIGSKLFAVAGPVLVYGAAVSVLAGILAVLGWC